MAKNKNNKKIRKEEDKLDKLEEKFHHEAKRGMDFDKVVHNKSDKIRKK